MNNEEVDEIMSSIDSEINNAFDGCKDYFTPKPTRGLIVVGEACEKTW